MLVEEKIMEVLEAYDLTKSLRSAAALCGVDHHTVKRYVAARSAGLDPAKAVVRGSVSDPFSEKIVEWIEASQGRVRADVVHRKLEAMGYEGSERTTRRVVAALKQNWVHEHRRGYKPWIPEPGLWLQWDYGEGPRIGDARTHLFCAWLAWSRFRVILPMWDKKMPSVITALDRCFRIIGGIPTYLLTDNEKTVTDTHIARVAVRNPQIVAAGHYYGVTITTCVPFDPESKGGSEATVRIAKADLVPTAGNLLDDYETFEQLEEACAAATLRFNTRVHTVTREKPVDRLVTELELLHRVPEVPYTAAFGETRAVSWSSTISFRGARYSVPHTWMGTRVWVRVSGDEIIITAQVDDAATEIARHAIVGSGEASIVDAHYPPRRDTPVRVPKATSRFEAAFLEIGQGAQVWLIEAAGLGIRGIEARMGDAVALTEIHDPAAVDEALAAAAKVGRFGDGDLESILTYRHRGPILAPVGFSLQPGTQQWSQPGTNGNGVRR
ncbi:MAG: IS21 family transposase [Acidobacteria bacterium]|nr:IS21 family transposase [Acidobacteriota bacterium]